MLSFLISLRGAQLIAPVGIFFSLHVLELMSVRQPEARGGGVGYGRELTPLMHYVVWLLCSLDVYYAVLL